MFEVDDLELNLDEDLQVRPFLLSTERKQNSSKTQISPILPYPDRKRLKTDVTIISNNNPLDGSIHLLNRNISNTRGTDHVERKHKSGQNQMESTKENNSGRALELINSSRVNIRLGMENSNYSDPGTPSFQKSNKIIFNTDSPNANRSKTDKPKVSQRKFPGPAGILPDKPPTDYKEPELPEKHVEENIEVPVPSVCSQSPDALFNEAHYLRMLNDFGLNDQNSPLNQFSIDWAIRKTLCRKINGLKIPFLTGVILKLDCSSPDPLVTLKDHSGQINGTLHRTIWNEMGVKLSVGSVLVLKQVGIIITGPSRKQVYLNITQNNLLSIYSSSDGNIVSHSINPFVSLEILRSIQDWQNSMADSPAKNSDNSIIDKNKLTPIKTQLFTSVTKPQFNFNPKLVSSPFAHKPACKEQLNNQQSQTSCNFDIGFDLDDDLDQEIIKASNHIQETITRNEVAHAVSKFQPKFLSQTSTQNLSQDESKMLEEVLHGIDFEDFA